MTTRESRKFTQGDYRGYTVRKLLYFERLKNYKYVIQRSPDVRFYSRTQTGAARIINAMENE